MLKKKVCIQSILYIVRFEETDYITKFLTRNDWFTLSCEAYKTSMHICNYSAQLFVVLSLLIVECNNEYRLLQGQVSYKYLNKLVSNLTIESNIQ